MVEGSIHRLSIASVLRDYPGSQVRGFRKAVQKVKWNFENWAGSEENPTWQDFLSYGEAWKDGLLPDAWLIDPDCMSVICFEVEDSNRLNSAKIDRYVSLWWHLDNFYWEIHLLCVGRWGRIEAVPITEFTSLASVTLEGHPLRNVIEADRNAKRITFELSKIYCIRDIGERLRRRSDWMKANQGFVLEEFIGRRERPEVADPSQ